MIISKIESWPTRLLTALMTMAILVVYGCVSTPPPPAWKQAAAQPAQSANDYRLDKGEIQKINNTIFSRATPPGDPGEYLLGEGDLLNVSVFEAEELETTVRVSSRGFITLPLIKTVTVKGLTAMEAEEKIESLYRKRYINDPHVSVFVKEHVSQRVTLMGQFNKPGTYDYPTKLRLLDVIALGGGLSEKAGQIIQIRKLKSSKPEAFMVDLDRLISEGNVELNIEINGGDVIFIPEAGVFFVDGAVKRPGAYAIKHHTTVREAIIKAGGFEYWAIKDKLTLVRMTKTGDREIVELDLAKPGTTETAIGDRDILVIDESASAGKMHGFGISILGTGFSYSGR